MFGMTSSEAPGVKTADAYLAEELAASMITAATRSGIESIGT